MDLKDYMALVAGTEVEVLLGRKWVRALVTREAVSGYPDTRAFSIRVRRVGFTKSGLRPPGFWRTHDKVRFADKTLNRATANVYADWLDDNCEPRAAEKLRRHFPLEDGK